MGGVVDNLLGIWPGDTLIIKVQFTSTISNLPEHFI